jgi:hypothetical protein
LCKGDWLAIALVSTISGALRCPGAISDDPVAPSLHDHRPPARALIRDRQTQNEIGGESV